MNNLSIWGATFYGAVHHLDLKIIGARIGLITVVAGVPATIFGGMIADWFRRRAPGGRMLYSALLSLSAIPCFLVFVLSPNANAAFAANLFLAAAALAWLGAAAADITEIAGANLRGLGIGIYFFAVNFSGYVVGANIIGQLSDQLGARENPEMMRYALLVCPLACALAAVCLWAGSRSLNNPKN